MFAKACSGKGGGSAAPPARLARGVWINLLTVKSLLRTVAVMLKTLARGILSELVTFAALSVSINPLGEELNDSRFKVVH